MDFFGLPYPTEQDIDEWAQEVGGDRAHVEMLMPIICLEWWMGYQDCPRPVARPQLIDRADRIFSRQLWASFSMYVRLLMLQDRDFPVLPGCYVCAEPTHGRCELCGVPFCSLCARDPRDGGYSCYCAVVGRDHLNAFQAQATGRLLAAHPVFGREVEDLFEFDLGSEGEEPQ